MQALILPSHHCRPTLANCVYAAYTPGLRSAAHHQTHHLQEPFAHADLPPAKDLLEAVQQLRPSILIGVSTVANAFTQDVCETMAAINARPLIFPLSNPTSKSECSFEQAVSKLC